MNKAQMAEKKMLESKLAYKIANNVCGSEDLVNKFHETYTLDDAVDLIDVYEEKLILSYSDGSKRVILGNFG